MMATVRSKHNASLNTFVSVALHNLTSLPEFTRLTQVSSSHFLHIKLDKFHTHFESSRQDFCHCQLFQLYPKQVATSTPGAKLGWSGGKELQVAALEYIAEKFRG